MLSPDGTHGDLDVEEDARAQWGDHRSEDERAAGRAAIRTLAALRGIAGVGAYGNDTGLLLSSGDIGSTYGFDQGRLPTVLHLALEDWYGEPRALATIEWHVVLWEMVHDHLLPTLGMDDLDMTLWAGHRFNPVRTFDSRPIPFEMVRVPWMDVLAHTVDLLNCVDAHESAPSVTTGRSGGAIAWGPWDEA